MLEKLREIVNTPSPTEVALEHFSKDTSRHQLHILNDSGLYRHLRFKEEGRSDYYFDLTTWPGHLCISGDMGSYVFSRSSDMFRFFRDDKKSSNTPIHEKLNLTYWAEKVQSSPPHNGTPLAISPRSVIEYVLDSFDHHIKDNHLSVADSLDLAEEIENVMSSISGRDDVDGANEAIRNLCDFYSHGLSFSEIEPKSLKEPSYQFTWCCAAIVWGVSLYDAHPDVMARQKVESSASPGM